MRMFLLAASGSFPLRIFTAATRFSLNGQNLGDLDFSASLQIRASKFTVGIVDE